MLQMEGFRVRLSPSREAREHLRDQHPGEPASQP